MSEQFRSYYAIIPANVRYDNELTANAKLLYGEITALCNDKGYCWATNEYFSNLYGVSKTSISKWISSLIKKGYINSEIIYKEGTKEILNRYLRIVNNPIEEKLNTPIEEKLKDNNTLVNNTINIKKERKKESNYDSIINELVNDNDLKESIYDFIKMRKLIKKPLTDRALRQLINRLYTLSTNKKDQLQILENSIINSWANIYELKQSKPNASNTYKREEKVPEWFNKKVETEKNSPEEQAELEELLKEFKEDDSDQKKRWKAKQDELRLKYGKGKSE